MVRKCLNKDCKTEPSYNYKNEKIPLYCNLHKLINMIDVINKKCLNEFCETRPGYNYENERIGLYCVLHKLDNMIDVKNKRCLNEFCDKIPTFNYENEKNPLYCSLHKLDNMVDVVSKRCLNKNCKTQATYNYENETKRLYCKLHKLDNMIDIASKRCLNENCDTQIKLKYKGYCLNCFIHKYPNEPVSRNYKIKEKYFTDLLKEIYTDFIIVENKSVSCSLRKPDAYLELETHTIIIEIDENQHKSYDTSCDNKRTMELFQDFGNRPIVFIRFNPDKYNEFISCFKLLRNGIITLNEKSNYKYRIDLLKECIEYNIKNIPYKEISIKYICYDT